jgi:hypothetical protein
MVAPVHRDAAAFSFKLQRREAPQQLEHLDLPRHIFDDCKPRIARGDSSPIGGVSQESYHWTLGACHCEACTIEDTAQQYTRASAHGKPKHVKALLLDFRWLALNPVVGVTSAAQYLASQLALFSGWHRQRKRSPWPRPGLKTLP